MASSLAMATLAASSEASSHPSSGRGSTGGSGSWTKALNRSPLEPSTTYIPTRFRCIEDLRYWPNANSGDRYWRGGGGELHIRLPGRRSRRLFPAFRATHDSESGRLGWGNQAPVPLSSGTLGISSR